MTYRACAALYSKVRYPSWTNSTYPPNRLPTASRTPSAPSGGISTSASIANERLTTFGVFQRSIRAIPGK
jgi:hypothetical protein